MFAKASENAVGDVETSFSWQQPPPAAYNIPYNTTQGQPHRPAFNHAGGSDQQKPQYPLTGGGFHPSGNVSMQPYYAMTDQRIQGNNMPQHGVPPSYNRLGPRGIRLRPVSDLRMQSSRHQHRVLMLLPPADAYRSLFTFGVFNAIQSTCFDTVSLSAMLAIPSF